MAVLRGGWRDADRLRPWRMMLGQVVCVEALERLVRAAECRRLAGVTRLVGLAAIVALMSVACAGSDRLASDATPRPVEQDPDVHPSAPESPGSGDAADRIFSGNGETLEADLERCGSVDSPECRFLGLIVISMHGLAGDVVDEHGVDLVALGEDACDQMDIYSTPSEFREAAPRPEGWPAGEEEEVFLTLIHGISAAILCPEHQAIATSILDGTEVPVEPSPSGSP